MVVADGEWFDRPGGEPVELSGPDPAWAAEAGKWATRILMAIAPSQATVEHVGSTAVPGMTAKPVIDLQVAVPRLEDEIAYRPGLESLGLILRQRETSHRFFRPPAGQLRTVHVHVCERNSKWERDHLRFRDLLRRDEELAGAYAELKRQLALDVGHDRLAYNRGKSAFIIAALSRSQPR